MESDYRVKPKIADLIPPDLPDIHERIMLREASGLSARQLAAVVGVSFNTIYRWERGERVPKGANRVAYADALRELADIKGRA